jgi:hypothetical protein
MPKLPENTKQANPRVPTKISKCGVKMAQMNYNRPNGGYESEPWRKPWTPEKYKLKSLPQPVIQHQETGHKIIKIKANKGPHKGYYKCADCNKWLAWANI